MLKAPIAMAITISRRLSSARCSQKVIDASSGFDMVPIVDYFPLFSGLVEPALVSWGAGFVESASGSIDSVNSL